MTRTRPPATRRRTGPVTRAAVRLAGCRDRGATMPEYAITVGFIALVAVIGAEAVGVSLNQLFRAAADAAGAP